MHRQRFRNLSSSIAAGMAVIAAILVGYDAIEHHPGFVVIGLSMMSLSVAVYFAGLRPPVSERRDLWTTVPWGGVFVALVYLSVAVFCLVAYAVKSGFLL